jgi:hypothetical protein
MLLGLASPRQALALISENAHFTDVAGLFAVALAKQYALLSPECLAATVMSPLRNGDLQTQHETLGDILCNLLADYANLLHSVGNLPGEKLVSELMDNIPRESPAPMD